MKKIKTIEVGASIFEENDRVAQENRLLLKKNAVFSVNIMGSRLGKITVLDITLNANTEIATGGHRGDIQGATDAQRLERSASRWYR